MNPDRLILEYIGRQRERAEAIERSRRAELHRKAVARRKAAKRGGGR